MYKLYGEIAGWKMLDISANEGDMLITMDEYLKDNEKIHFLIIKHENNTDEPYKSIRSMEDYVSYLEEYNKRTQLMNMSCVDLKRDIVGKQRTKTRR